ncbi:hypothetical protein GCM10009765_71910 [Fodinicola feengrottensis]|uniref:Uncharacterized protein n=1 Tax=Fodinicola feengrottensis TaxID=435914 RepID=A0ABN2IV52_9ACTN
MADLRVGGRLALFDAVGLELLLDFVYVIATEDMDEDKRAEFDDDLFRVSGADARRQFAAQFGEVA